jgi:hypothetical protein
MSNSNSTSTPPSFPTTCLSPVSPEADDASDVFTTFDEDADDEDEDEDEVDGSDGAVELDAEFREGFMHTLSMLTHRLGVLSICAKIE